MKVKELYVKVTYHVGLSDVEVSNELYEALQQLADRGKVRGDFVHSDGLLDTAIEWLEDNIEESDACDWEYEIEDMEDYENE